MNKKRTAKAVLAAFGLSIALPTAAFAATDINGHWAESVLNKWEQKGLMGGYEDGTIRPDNAITRAEFVSLVNRVAGFDTAGDIAFTDVSADDWYAAQVAIGVNAAYIGGYPDDTFRPNAYVTRAEAASMIARLYELPADTARAAQFADAAQIPDWAAGVIGAVANAGYMVGDTNNNFNAQVSMTRAEAAAALDRVFAVEDVKALEASLSETNGSITKGSTKAITVNAPDGATVRALSTNESVATAAVSGHTITITAVEKGNATIAITVSAPGYADAKLVYSVHVTASAGGGGGGSSSSTEVVTDDADITLPDGYSHEDVEIRTVVYKYGIDDDHHSDLHKDAVTYVEMPETLQVSAVTLPAGSDFNTTIGNKSYDMILTSDLTKTAVENITVADVKAVIATDSEAYAALDTLEDDRVLIYCTQDAEDHLHWYIDGKEHREIVEVFNMLQLTITEVPQS